MRGSTGPPFETSHCVPDKFRRRCLLCRFAAVEEEEGEEEEEGVVAFACRSSREKNRGTWPNSGRILCLRVEPLYYVVVYSLDFIYIERVLFASSVTRAPTEQRARRRAEW
jgi:hypothetical protein